jgi:hypothetical protein
MLAGNFRQVFGFKGVMGKVSWNKDLHSFTTMKMVLGKLEGSVLGIARALFCPSQWLLLHRVNWRYVMAVTISL